MFVAEIFKITKPCSLVPLILKSHPVFISESYLKRENKEKIRKNAAKSITNTLLDIKSRKEIIYDNSVVMVVVKDMDPSDSTCLKTESFLIEKKDIINKDSLWTGENCIHRFGYNFIDWDQVLGYELCPMSLSELSVLELACEIFCELTRFGFTEKRIKRTGASISRNIGDMNIGFEINEARKKRYSETNPWFSKLCDKINLSKAPREMNLSGTQEKIIVLNNEKIHMKYIRSIKI